LPTYYTVCPFHDSVDVILLIFCGCTQAAAPSGFVLMPVGTDVSCEDMFADESDFEFDVENERALASVSTGTETKQAQAVPLTAQAAALTAHTSKVLGNVRFLFGLTTVKSGSSVTFSRQNLNFLLKTYGTDVFFHRTVALGRGLDVGKAFRALASI
jgi:hypothetical protein